MKNRAVGPDPNVTYSIDGIRSLTFLRNGVKSPNIIVGDYTYCDDPDDPGGFEKHVLHHYELLGDRPIISV